MNEKDLLKNSKTDWARLSKMSDEDIDTSDIPGLDESFFSTSKLRMPEGKVSVLLNIDEEIISWYQKQGKDFQVLVNAALKTYVENHR